MIPSREPALRAIAWMLIATIGPGTPVHAGDILRGGAATSAARRNPGSNANAGAEAAALARTNARDRLARTTTALQSVKAMQAAARAAAAMRRSNNLGLNPNRLAEPLQRKPNGLNQRLLLPTNENLPDVRDGLRRGGLKVADGVPRDLKKPGKNEDPLLWQGAELPTESKSGGETTVTIEQTEQQAILSWETFNIGRKTTVEFDQSAGKENASEWIAFNKVSDPSGAPSQILGSIKAEGQVYVLNQNGIIFGGTSQVNVHTLVASSLPINDGLIARGLLNNPDAQFLFSALPITAGADGTPAFAPEPVLTPTGEVGDVVVQAGALIESPTSAEKIGGRVMLVGANVDNAGTISTPDGQTILAGGLQVGVNGHSGDDPSLRGLDVFIGAVDSDPESNERPYAGTATNSGFIDAPRANVTIAGREVNQLGVIDNSTSVSLNGRIDLQANYGAVSNVNFDPTSAVSPPFLYASAGTITLGEGSVTRILPEIDSDEIRIGTELSLRSQINVQGQVVHLDRDAMVLAPNAAIDIKAGTWSLIADKFNPSTQFVYVGGQIYAEPGALIDATGTPGVDVPLSQSILEVELRGAELADSPLQREGILRSQKLTVDVRRSGEFNGREWVGSPLGDVSGFVGLIERNAAQQTVAGGSVTMQAGDSVVLQRGSAIDVSGGWVQHESGFVETTRVTSGGQIFDISEATPDRVYDGIYTTTSTRTREKWGISETFARPLAWTGRYFDSAYIEGADGGSIAITAPAMALDGKLTGQTVIGPRQLRDAQGATKLPEVGALSLVFRTQDPTIYSGQSRPLFLAISPAAPDITFGAPAQQAPANPFAIDREGRPVVANPDGRLTIVPVGDDPFAVDGGDYSLRADRRKNVFLSPELFEVEGFGALLVDNRDGDILVPAGVTLDVRELGSITLFGANITVRGAVSAPGAELNFTTYSLSPYQAAILLANQANNPDFVPPEPDPERGTFTLGPRGRLSTAGLIVDDRFVSADRLRNPLVLDGGGVSIEGYSADLRLGSVIDVSGGVSADLRGRFAYGDAGGIAIKAGRDPNLKGLRGGTLDLAGTLLGFSGATGGSLSLQASRIKIGGAKPDRNTLVLAPEFFSEGGFGSFSLAGIGMAIKDEIEQYRVAVEVLPGTQVAPVVTGLRARAEGSDPLVFERVLKPMAERTPVDFTLEALGAKDDFLDSSQNLVVRGDIVVGTGSELRTEPGGSVTLDGDTVAVRGSLIAPGGAITIKGAGEFPSLNLAPESGLPTVYLAPTSRLSTAGALVLTPNDLGQRTGYVLPGGTIELSGNIVTRTGAVLDVSGASGMLDFVPAVLGLNALLTGATDVGPVVPVSSGINGPLASRAVVRTRVDSDGGAIVLKGSELLLTDATLRGAAGGPTALGGSLEISSGRFYPRVGLAPTPLDITLTVTRKEPTLPAPPPPPQFPASQDFPLAAVLPREKTIIGEPIYDAEGEVLPGQGYFTANRFANGGFDSLTLGGVVEFSGPVELDAPGSLTVADGGVLYADAPVTLRAPYVKLGTEFRDPLRPGDPALTSVFNLGGTPFFIAPTKGQGRLTVIASLIDIGNLSLQNIRRASFLADNGDIRGNGTLNIAGNLFFRAGQVYPTTAGSFTIAAYDYFARGENVLGPVPLLDEDDLHLPFAYETVGKRGSVTFAGSGVRQLPLSAGGELNVYGSIIEQGGTLRAPLGSINIGWDGTGTAPADLLAGTALPRPQTRKLMLAPGSVTSVSAVDPATGEGLIIPYGINVNGTSWIDPRGFDITGGGVPAKSIALGAARLNVQRGSSIDVSGGGDLYAYRWIEGQGGSEDILASTSSYAVIPGYEAEYAPRGDPGYVNSGLSVGDRIYLDATDSLAAGVYTLLPARYALLPGGVLVTPVEGAPRSTLALPDGSSVVSGTRFNSLNRDRVVPTLRTRFEVASAEVFRARAEYEDTFANRFLRKGARDLELDVPRLPIDAGRLVFQAVESLRLRGAVSGGSIDGGRGASIDISSPRDILIAGPGVTVESSVLERDLTQLGGFGKPPSGVLLLRAADLNSFDAESLLVGGLREPGVNGTRVVVTTGRLAVDNRGQPLTGPEIILTANRNLTLGRGAEIAQLGEMLGDAERLLLRGDGTLLRVSSDFGAESIRTDVTASTIPTMEIGAGARIMGMSVALDSTYATSLSPTASLLGESIALSSGQISMALRRAGKLLETEGLVLEGPALRGLQSARALSLLSYSSIDIYGFGSFTAAGSLELHAGEIRGFNTRGRPVTFAAPSVLLDNVAEAVSPGPISGQALDGSLVFDAGTIRLGDNQLDVDHYASLILNARESIVLDGEGGLATTGKLTATTPLVRAEPLATQTIRAAGDVEFLLPLDAPAAAGTSGLGASLTIEGASVRVASDVVLPGGLLTLHATSGAAVVSGLLDVSGASKSFYDLVRSTDAGRVSILSDNGAVTLAETSMINVSAQPEGGNAGSLSILAGDGGFSLGGTLLAAGGDGGLGGMFALDVGVLRKTKRLDEMLNLAGFSESRSIRVRNGDVLVDGIAAARHYALSTDRGSIRVAGTIDASGERGGSIALRASGSVALAPDSLLTVAGREFDAAGKGGAVWLEAGAAIDGVIDDAARVDIQRGSTLDLSVAANRETSAAAGQLTGTLHVRAPQTADHADVRIDPIQGEIRGASRLTVEGYRLYDLTATNPTNATITTAIQTQIRTDANAFLGAAGSESPGYAAMLDRLLDGNPGLASVLVIQPGAEIVHRTGDLTLGTSGSSATTDFWDLSGFRFGPKSAPGVLTLRAAGDLVFFDALSDGFVRPTTSTPFYRAVLMAQNPLLPLNAQSWSYRLTAGADFGAADFHRVQPLADLAADKGSLKLGKNAGVATANPNGRNAQTSQAIGNRYQVIRTGSGDIDIATGRDIQLLNQFATIYTAGTQVVDPTMGGRFDLPYLDTTGAASSLGLPQQEGPPGYPAHYSLAGGNVSLNAQGDIIHLTRDTLNNVVDDSSRQMPTNWLYRRGFVDPVTGEFGGSRWNTETFSDIASTTWWVDFANFFEGVGALGGGNVTLIAGRDVRNVDAVIPTNARAPKGRPDPSTLVELGGGDLVVRAGHDINAGVYYVERGEGTLTAGNSIVTNSTRTPSIGRILGEAPLTEETWLPTTLFLGKGGFDVSARGDLLLGPTANPFLLPGGFNNSHWYKTYFSTYAPENFVNVSSLGGAITFRTEARPSAGGVGGPQPILLVWYDNVLRFGPQARSNPSFYQPWLRLNETSVLPFGAVSALMPGTLRATAFSSDINLVGDITLSPAPRGTLEFAAARAINGLQPQGITNIDGATLAIWGSSRINVSDADPSAIPGIASPFAYQAVVGTTNTVATGTSFLLSIDRLFAETGSTDTVLETKQALHDQSLLHADDPNPVRVYARRKDISGLTLFSPKQTRIIAGQDISDIAFYIQHVGAEDISVVSAGRDILAFNENSALRAQARSAGNILNSESGTLAGDIQISGPGVLEVLAGRDLDLGTGTNNPDGTGVGITSIGNARNPALPFEGASLIVGAGIGPSSGLESSALDFDAFIEEFVEGETGAELLAEFAKQLDGREFEDLPAEQRSRIALEIFYLVLRDAGRNFNVEGSPGFGNYDTGFAAIASLFGEGDYDGQLELRGRDVRTRSGGDISLFAPGGGLALAKSEIGNPLAPPGVITETGGNISIFAHESVDIGIGRIFTLRGGNEIIWSSTGDIAAGSSSKTVQSAPPTRVILDPQSADVKTDLAGLATGGGIGVLATVEGVEPGDVDLIAPVGVVDAGDAGIRVSGNLNIAATQVLNASNIAVAGTSAGTPPAPVVTAPNIAGLTAASNTAGAQSSALNDVASQARGQAESQQEAPSIITVEVIGYGGGSDEATGPDDGAGTL